jgi:hypothetical protein
MNKWYGWGFDDIMGIEQKYLFIIKYANLIRVLYLHHT